MDDIKLQWLTKKDCLNLLDVLSEWYHSPDLGTKELSPEDDGLNEDRYRVLVKKLKKCAGVD